MQNINLPIPEELLAALDKIRGDVPRTVWIRRAIEQRIAKEAKSNVPAARSNLPLIGRDYTLVGNYAKKLRTTPLSQRGVRGRRGSTWETKRGVAWEVLLELDGKATGHVCRVEVMLDRLDHDLAEGN